MKEEEAAMHFSLDYHLSESRVATVDPDSLPPPLPSGSSGSPAGMARELRDTCCSRKRARSPSATAAPAQQLLQRSAAQRPAELSPAPPCTLRPRRPTVRCLFGPPPSRQDVRAFLDAMEQQVRQRLSGTWSPDAGSPCVIPLVPFLPRQPVAAASPGLP
eukprot:scaffold1.g5254.t1